MLFPLPFLLLLALSLSSCTSRGGEQAEAFALVDSLLRGRQYAKALRYIDSVVTASPADTAILSRAIRLKRQVRKEESEYMLLKLDSQLQDLSLKRKLCLEDFVEQRNEQYDTPLRYVHRSLVGDSYTEQKPHLRVQLTDAEASFVSVYIGEKPLEHNALRVEFPAIGERYDTMIVSYDKALNYRYFDGVRYWELVNYSHRTGEELQVFLLERMRAGHRPRFVLLSGDKAVYTLQLSSEELKAIYESLELGEVMTAQRDAKLWQEVYATRFARLDR